MQSLAKHTLTNMAIPFLNNINLDDNQLQNAKLHVTSSAPTAAAGQIYFDSTVGTETAKYYDGSTWISLIQYTTANSTFINLAESGTDATRTLTASLSATGTPSATTFLRGDNTWASISDNDTTYDLTGTGSTNGTAGVLLTGSDATTDTVLIVGSGTTTVTRSGNTLTVTSNDQYDGTVTSVDTGNSTFISGSGGPITSSGTLTAQATANVQVLKNLGTDNDQNSSGTLTYSLSATGTPDSTKYLRGDNTWSAISGIYSWTVAGDTGSETIVNGDTVTFAGGTNVTTAYDTGTNTLTINSTDQYVGTVTSVGLSMPSAFTVTNSPVTSSGTLTVTGAGTVSQYIDGTGALQTFPTSDNYQYWTLTDGSTSTNITSTATATFQGTANEVEVRESSGTITVGLPDDVTIAGELTVSGTGQSSFAGQVTIPATPTANTDAASKQYVDNSVVGNLVYQGGYNAATNTPDLDSSPSSSIKKGWTYTVTADGTFFTEQVRVGDVLIAEVNAPTALADWTTVQNNIDLADLTTVGIGNVNAGTGIGVAYSSGTATVTNTGVTQLTAGEGIDISASTGSITIDGEDSTPSNKGIVIVAGGTGVNVSYASGTATVSADYSDSSFAGTLSATGTITHNLGSRDVIVQLYDTVTYETVYADVDRGTNTVTVTFASIPTNSIRVLVQKIG